MKFITRQQVIDRISASYILRFSFTQYGNDASNYDTTITARDNKQLQGNMRISSENNIVSTDVK